MTRDAGSARSSSPSPRDARPRTEPASLLAALGDALSRTRTTARAAVVVATLAIAGLLYGGPNASEIRDSASWKFWLQVATGNYSPDQPLAIDNEEWVAGTVVAFIVNLGSFVLVFGAILELIRVERKKLMDTREAYGFRDMDIQATLHDYIVNKFDKKLKEADHSQENAQLLTDISKIFSNANKKLADEIVAAYGPEGQQFVEKNKLDLPEPR